MPIRIFSDANTPIYILWLLRNGTVTDWPSLADHFGSSSDFVDTLGTFLLGHLQQLREVGLITYKDAQDNGIRRFRRPISGRIELSNNWTKLQAALDVSLTELTKLGPTSMVVTPYFGRPNEQTASVDLFVLMPFESVLKPVYEDHIVNVAQ